MKICMTVFLKEIKHLNHFLMTSLLSYYGKQCDVHTFGKFFSHFLRQIYFPLEDLPSVAFYTVVIFYILSQGLLSCVYESVSSTQ